MGLYWLRRVDSEEEKSEPPCLRHEQTIVSANLRDRVVTAFQSMFAMPAFATV